MTGNQPLLPDGPRDEPRWEDWIAAEPPHPLQQAGGAETRFAQASIEICEVQYVAVLRLHSLRPHTVLDAALRARNVRLPVNVNACEGLDPAILCVAPGDWLLFSELQQPCRLQSLIEPALDTALEALVDLSAAFAVFRVSGPASKWLLAKLCSLDVQSSVGSGRYCARTRMLQLAVTLHYYRPGGQPAEVFDVFVDRSLALDAWQMLIAACPHADELYQRFG